MAQALLAVADVLKCIEISFKFIPKILMSKECVHFFGPLCIYYYKMNTTHTTKAISNPMLYGKCTSSVVTS